MSAEHYAVNGVEGCFLWGVEDHGLLTLVGRNDPVLAEVAVDIAKYAPEFSSVHAILVEQYRELNKRLDELGPLFAAVTSVWYELAKLRAGDHGIDSWCEVRARLNAKITPDQITRLEAHFALKVPNATR